MEGLKGISSEELWLDSMKRVVAKMATKLKQQL